ncbi:MAG: response regulator, partial [Humidesulfovibrio sp.]|nr:response regulator [Humidesulfovibrio sp.]
MSILVIDDEPGLRRSLCAYLEDRDYGVLEAANGEEGLVLLDQNLQNLEAVIVDLNMPVMDGYSFLQEAVTRTRELPLIVLSGVGIVEDALRAMRLGAWDFITKPLHSFEILDYTLAKVLEKARLLKENRSYQAGLEHLVDERTAELELTRRQVMQRLSRAAEYKDNETGRHVIRVGEISALLSRAMGLSVERCEMLRECAPLHDVGKIGIPDDILLKPGKFTEPEWKIMQLHCTFGCEILGPLTSKDAAH